MIRLVDRDPDQRRQDEDRGGDSQHERELAKAAGRPHEDDETGGEEHDPQREEPPLRERDLRGEDSEVEEPDDDERGDGRSLQAVPEDQQEEPVEPGPDRHADQKRPPEDAQLDVGLVLLEQREQREDREHNRQGDRRDAAQLHAPDANRG